MSTSTLRPASVAGVAARQSVPRWALLALATWLALVAIAAALQPPGHRPSLCFFRTVTGMPCPTCGSTRAVLALSRGDLANALKANPLVPLALLGLSIFLVAQGVGVAPRRFSLSRCQGRTIGMVLLLLLAANWLYLLLREQT